MWLSMLPWRWIGAAMAVLAALAGVWSHGSRSGFDRGDAGRIKVQSVLEHERLDAAERMAEATSAARAEESRRAAAQQEVADELAKVQAQARADAAGAAAAADRLRQRVVALVAASGGRSAANPAVAAASAPADDAAGMLAELFGRCVARARFLATVADDRGAAGAACQQSYEALTR